MENSNELLHQLLGTGSSLNSFLGADSLTRAAMANDHLRQYVVVEGATKRPIVSGVEHLYGQATFKDKMPVDGRIVEVVERYPTKHLGSNHHKDNPEIVVIYQDLDSTGGPKLDAIVLNSHHCMHQQFGYKQTPNKSTYRELIPNNVLQKGTVFNQSPIIADDGQHMFGIDTNVAYMSIPEIIEDGFVISEDYANRLSSTVMGTRTISVGRKEFLLNLYGDDTHYKAFPDVGDKVREDGLLFAARTYEEMLAPVEMSRTAVKEYDPYMDRTEFAEPGAEIVDVKILRSGERHPTTLPVGMEWQMEYYAQHQLGFYRKIQSTYQQFCKRQPEDVIIGHKLHQLLIEAQAYDRDKYSKSIMLTWRAEALDDYRIEITYAKKVPAKPGFKITGLHGNDF